MGESYKDYFGESSGYLSEKEKYNTVNVNISKNQIYGKMQWIFEGSDNNRIDKPLERPGNFKEMFNKVTDMFEGNIELNVEDMLRLLDELNLYPEELLDIFSRNDCYGLCNNKEFILKAIERTGGIFSIAVCASADVIKQILQDRELIEQIVNGDRKIPNFMSGIENISIFVYQIIQYEELYNDKQFMMEIMNYFGSRKNQMVAESIINIILEKCQQFLQDKEFTMCVLDFIDKAGDGIDEVENREKMINALLCSKELSKDAEVAEKYIKIFGHIEKVSEELLNDREFLRRVMGDIVDDDFYLPEVFGSDIEIIKEYLTTIGRNNEGIHYSYYSGISLECLNNPEVMEILEEFYGEKPNIRITEEIARMIGETGTVVTHFGDDLDNKAAIQALQKWAEENDLIKIGYPLNVIRIPAGQIKKGFLNVDTGGHKGSRIETDKEGNISTVVIDGDIKNGVKSACQALSRLGIYVPEQIVLAPEFITAGSAIAYEKGINYYVSASQHLDSEGKPDGVTFSIDEVAECVNGIGENEILQTMQKLVDGQTIQEEKESDERM